MELKDVVGMVADALAESGIKTVNVSPSGRHITIYVDGVKYHITTERE